MKPPPIAITGLGIVSAAGWSLTETWSAIAQERSGLNPLTLFESNRRQNIPVGEVSGAGEDTPRSEQLAWHAAHEAFVHAGMDKVPEPQRRRTALVLGICTGGMFESETFAREFLLNGQWPVEILKKHTCANTSNAVANRLGLTGPRYTVSNACASGAAAISIACEMLQSGEADIVLAGGVDSLTRLILNGFCSLLVVSDEGCRPFDADRKGMSVGEGAGMMVLETGQHARKRGAEIHGFVAGWGNTCSAYHPAAPDPDGSGALDAMSRALEVAGCRPRDVDYINAHGSGTMSNDSAESQAITKLFANHSPLVSSTKRFFGHTLAAAGAIEAIVCILAMKHQMVPANLGLRNPCQQATFDLARKTAPANIKVALSNSIGFGGSNSSLVLTNTRPAGKTVTCRVDTSLEVVVEGLGMIHPEGKLVPMDFPRDTESGSCMVYQCIARPHEGLITSKSARRLGRVQKLGVSAAHLAMRDSNRQVAGRDVSVYLGTGLGSITETAAFVENMILKNEMEPKPATFINSVHNSIASWIAIEFGFQGKNLTFTHDAISFDQALHRAMTDLARGDTKYAMVVGADELSPYLLSVGDHCNWWQGCDDPLSPMGSPDHASAGTLPGEGATAILLGTQPACEQGEGIRIRAVGDTVLRKTDIARFDPQIAVDFIQNTLATSGGSIRDMDCVLLGANGDCRYDELYRSVARALSAIAGKELGFGVYKHLCGEFCTASTTALGLAIEMLKGRETGLRMVPPGPTQLKAKPTDILVYNLYESGFQSACWVAK